MIRNLLVAAFLAVLVAPAHATAWRIPPEADLNGAVFLCRSAPNRIAVTYRGGQIRTWTEAEVFAADPMNWREPVACRGR